MFESGLSTELACLLLFDDEHLYYCDFFYLCASCENDFLQYSFLRDMRPSHCNNLESSELKFTTRSEGVSSKSAYSEKKALQTTVIVVKECSH